MDKATPRPVRKTHTSFSDMLTWPETPSTHTSSSSVSQNVSRSTTLSNQQPAGVSKALFGSQITGDEDETHTRRRQCPDFKIKEMNGNSIFSADGERITSESGMNNFSTTNRTSVRIVQQASNGISQISFSTEQRVSPKRHTSVPEVAKQRELSGTLDSETDSKAGRHQSNAKGNELSGNRIFGPPSAIPPRSLAAGRSMGSKDSRDMREPAPRAIHTSVRVSNPAGGQSNIQFGEEPAGVKTTKKIHNQKSTKLTGNGIFQGDASPGSTEKSSNNMKLKEMSGNNIFADGKAENREHFAGVRRPPGGESSIRLI